MKRKWVWLLFALGAFLLLVPISISVYLDYQVYTKGTIISVEITSLDLNFINFKLGDKAYFKRVKNARSYWTVGETARLKFIKGREDHCLFADENPIPAGFLLIGALIFCGIMFIYYSSKKDAPPAKVFGVQIGE